MNRSLRGNDTFALQNELRKQFEGNQIQFVLTELDTAATFCDVAASAFDAEKTKRNIANARTAYDTALKFARNANFDEHTKIQFDTKRSRVEVLLTALGEHI